MTRIVVGPFNRVEGDLEVALEAEDGAVRAAFVSSSLYRGFEQILVGKAPLDALVLVPRVCGICSVAQSAAAAQALAQAMGLAPAEQGRIATNLMVAAENLADHVTHFYLFFLPDFARAAYSGRPWHGRAAGRFRAMAGEAAAELLPARARFLEVLGLLAGRWPHTLGLQPGGTSRALLASEKVHLFVLLREFRAFLERALFGDSLEVVGSIASLAELETWAREPARGRSDLALFLEIAGDLELWRLGRATDLFLSYGSYPQPAGRLFAPGLWDGAPAPLDPAQIREDATHAWLAEEGAPRHPSQGVTAPAADKAGAYTWCKAPRLGGRIVEVGALARQVVHGHPLARDLVARQGGSVAARVVARVLELALVLPEMERWARELAPGAPFCVQGELPDEAAGAGLVEAARGSLGHWLSVRRGRIHGYQIVAPTTWNFSPRDAEERPGALEQALVGTPVGEGERSVAVQHVVRSFDPCMVCTVH